MTSPMTAEAVLEREFLKARAKILEVGAILDRIERAEGDVAGDRRCKLLQQGLEILLHDDANRAERVQNLFSLPYHDNWRRQFELE